MSSAATALTPHRTGQRLGRYEVLTQLATGGMASVFIGRAQGVAGFERLVALKVLHPHLAAEEEFITMFLDEARLAARIRHPNVVPTLDVSDSAEAGYFLVMEYIEGDHFGALLRNGARLGERLPPPVVSKIILDALGGLAAAHDLRDERGEALQLVHRDVSPHNILVGTDGTTRLTDFGVVKAEVRLSSTREGQFKGKLGYMAPEHASSGEADQRSDLFSMGIVLWEGLAAQRLFRGKNNAETLHLILEGEVPPLSSIVPALAPFDPVLERALARPPEDRFQSAEAFMEALEAAAAAVGGVARSKEVAEVAVRLTVEKVETERRRLRGALDELGTPDVTARHPSLPPSSMSSAPPSLASVPASAEGSSNRSKAAAIADEEHPSNRTRWMWPLFIGLVALTAASVIVVFLAGRSAMEPSETNPADVTGLDVRGGSSSLEGDAEDTAVGAAATDISANDGDSDAAEEGVTPAATERAPEGPSGDPEEGDVSPPQADPVWAADLEEDDVTDLSPTGLTRRALREGRRRRSEASAAAASEASAPQDPTAGNREEQAPSPGVDDPAQAPVNAPAPAREPRLGDDLLSNPYRR